MQCLHVNTQAMLNIIDVHFLFITKRYRGTEMHLSIWLSTYVHVFMELNNSIIIMTFVYCNSSCEGNTLRKTTL